MANRTITVSVTKLFLDKENARHNPLDNEPEIIEQLLKKEKAAEVAKSIASSGSLSPFDRIGVVKHPLVKGGFTVIEGNRRVCALKMLLDPDKAPTESLRKTIIKCRAEGKPIPKEIEVVFFDSEQEAAPWIALRHRGEDGGAGTRSWNVVGKARHAARFGNSNANQLAVAILDYAEASGVLTKLQRDQVPATTITRYLGNPIVRHTLGLASAKDLEVDVPQPEFDTVIGKFLTDSLPKTASGVEPAVHSRSRAADWRQYAKDLQASGLSPRTRLAKAAPLKVRAPGKKGTRLFNPDNRSSVVAASFRHSFAGNKTLARIFKELRDIDAEKFSFAAAYLLRACLELLAKDYAKRHNLSLTGGLHEILGRCVKHLEADTQLISAMGAKQHKSALQPLRVASSNANASFSPEMLGARLHGSIVSKKIDLVRDWDSLEPGLELLAKGIA